MLNMGGPSTVPEVGPFLQRLFSDGEIVQLGRFQPIAGPLLAKRRTPKVEKQYAEIGGSPIRRWTELQGKELCARLDQLSPESAPHKPYIAFRYAAPLTEEALLQMKSDGITRAIAFSQYPQFSCTTSGSSLNHLWRELYRLDLAHQFQWSLIDRWFNHPKFIAAVQKRIEMGLEQFPEEEKKKAIIVFSAHSLPMKVVNRGDPYPMEVAATVELVMQSIQSSHGHARPYLLCWQSQVGPVPWLGPQTSEVIKGLGLQGHKSVLVVPIAFTSDHIETLFELDIENAHVAKEAGVEFYKRAPSLNDEPLLFEALAEIAAKHIRDREVCTLNYKMNCALCTNPMCRSVVNPAGGEYIKMRDERKPDSQLATQSLVNQKKDETKQRTQR